MKRRAKIAYRNLELCFPEMTAQERHTMVVKNFESVGMGVMETGMASVLARSASEPLDGSERSGAYP